ncbi:MAG: RIP metalloprotease RseP [Clostridia bacterium]|nr:RIP metalloprotease RseP [Clostridia bacterium]
MSIIVTLVELILILSIVAIVHEFGHFLVAKAFKMTVNEFSIGFGKKLWQKEHKGTKYTFRLFLLGGYVAIEGEEGDTNDVNSFSKKPAYQRILVLIAGVVFNFILAVIILMGINFSSDTLTTKLKNLPQDSVLYEAGLRDGDEILKIGNVTTHIYQDIALYNDVKNEDVLVKFLSSGEEKEVILKDAIKTKGVIGVYFKANADAIEGEILPLIDMVEPGGAAEKAGLKSGDLVIKVDGEAVTNTVEVINVVSQNPEKELTIEVLRNEEKETLTLIPNKTQYIDLGITEVEIEETTLAYSWFKSVNTVIRVVNSYADLFKGKVKLNQLSGIVGVGEMVSKTEGFIELLSLLATISLAIGMANIMPFPPLDGGKVVLVAIEGVTRKRVPQMVEVVLSYIGLGLLLALTVFVTIKDIIRII